MMALDGGGSPAMLRLAGVKAAEGSVDESAARWAGARAGRWRTELVWEWESVTSDGI